MTAETNGSNRWYNNCITIGGDNPSNNIISISLQVSILFLTTVYLHQNHSKPDPNVFKRRIRILELPPA